MECFIYCTVLLLSAIWPAPINTFLYPCLSPLTVLATYWSRGYEISHIASLQSAVTPTHCCIIQRRTPERFQNILLARVWVLTTTNWPAELDSNYSTGPHHKPHLFPLLYRSETWIRTKCTSETHVRGSPPPPPPRSFIHLTSLYRDIWQTYNNQQR